MGVIRCPRCPRRFEEIAASRERAVSTHAGEYDDPEDPETVTIHSNDPDDPDAPTTGWLTIDAGFAVPIEETVRSTPGRETARSSASVIARSPRR